MELVRVFFRSSRVCLEMKEEDKPSLFMPLTAAMNHHYVGAVIRSNVFKEWISTITARQLSKTDLAYIMSIFRMDDMGIPLVILRLGNVVEDECPVCYEKDKLCVFKPCGHNVCDDCDKTWYEQSLRSRRVGTCSLCRFEFFYHSE